MRGKFIFNCSGAFINWIRRPLRAFRSEQRGNVAATFAIAIIPVVGFVGAAVDYSRATSARAAFQAALDSTALMLSKASPNSMTQSALAAQAQTYFSALFNRPEAKNVAISASFTNDGGSQVTVSGSASVDTNFMGIMGYKTLTITGTSTTTWGNSRLRVALVLDNTGSMADSGKMDALKTATTNLLAQLKGAASSNGDVYVSIVPFVKDVNLGAANYTSSWIDWTDWEADNGTCTKYRNYYSWGAPGDQATCVAYRGTWTVASHSTWNGCVVDRGNNGGPDTTGNYDTNATAPSTTITSTLYAAEQYAYCPQAAMGLSYDWTSMNSLVSNMAPAGNTNQAIGLQVGWQSLAGGGPFTVPAYATGYTYNKIIILLTDGLNTQDRWYTSQTSIDARQALTCSNIKAAGITLYTIQVNTGGDPTSTLLQNCASSADKFFLLTNANQIVTTFNTIGTALTKLRVAK